MGPFRILRSHTLTPELRWLLLTLLLIGIVFRFLNLDGKVYWHDEVYTVMRAAGFTRGAIDQSLFQNQLLPAIDLQTFQAIKPDSTLVDTIQSLAVEDPQHPPLYFGLTRIWMQLFGNSAIAVRSLPALLSLLALPCLYALGVELFASPPAALISTTLLALSPFDILFAQTARQYSLLTTLTIASSWLLLRAIRINRWQSWLLYALACAVGLYTHPFFLLGLVAHGVYVTLLSLHQPTRLRLSSTTTKRLRSRLVRFLLAIALGITLFMPWLVVMISNLQRAFQTTDWSAISPGIVYLLKLWTLSFTALFFDLDFGFNNPVTYLLRLPVLIMIGIAIYAVCSNTRLPTWLFIVITSAVPFLLLVLPDLISGGKRSAVSRYLIACYPSIQLAVGFWLAWQLQHTKQHWRRVGMMLLLIGTLTSITISTFSETWWNRDLSYFNGQTAAQINAADAPVIVSDIGDDYTNTGDLIALSYRLKDEADVLLLDQPPDLTLVDRYRARDLLAFRPSTALQTSLEQQGWQFERISEGERLFQLTRSP